jgi:hypothetical protein
MAQSGYTPLLVYGSTTATNVPLAANLTTSASGVELAVNAADGKLFYKDSGGVVQVLASKAGNVNVASFQTSLGGLTPSTATTGIVTLAGTLNTSSGGTGLTSYTAGDLPYYAAGTVLSKLAIGTNGQILTSSGTAPQWSTLSGVAVTTFSAGTTGFTPSSATSGAITLGGTLATTNGGTGLTSFTANGVVYASSTSALATGSALTFDGTNLGVGGNSDPFGRFYTRSIGLTSSGSSVLEINGTSYGGIDLGTGGTRYFGITANSTDVILGSLNGAVPLEFQINGSEQMRLTSTGLGIGTSSPYSGTKLTIQESASNPGGIAIRNRNSTQTWQFSVDAAAVDDKILAFIDPGAGVVRMALDSAGNLGIGTTSPVGRLTIQGAAGTNGINQGIGLLYSNGTQYGALGLNNSTGWPQLMARAGAALTFHVNSDLLTTGEAMRLDASGNLGLGVTPSAWGSSRRILQMSNGAAFGDYSGYTGLSQNYFNNGSSDLYIATGYATRYLQGVGQHIWYNAPSGTAGNALTFTQAMTLDASGNLGIGTTSPATKLHVSSSGNTELRVQAGATAFLELVNGNSYRYDIQSNSADNSLRFVDQNAGSERMRIDSSGNFLVGNTDTTGIGVSVFPTGIIRHNTNGTVFEQFQYASSAVGSISTNGAITVYNTTSDYRLKTVVDVVTGHGARIDALQPIEYTWNSNGSRTRGFLAHQFQEVYADSVTGTKDAVDADGKPVYQAMQASTSEVIADLVAEIQSLRKRLAALEAK